MSYFAKNYKNLSLPIGSLEEKGLRNPQLGAVHAIASHFTLGNDPALITLPTGTGKTAVLLLTAFLLRPERVLLITPSRAVRDQVARECETLSTLRRIGAVPGRLDGPAVLEVKHRVKSAAEWQSMTAVDIVVGTPFSLSPRAPGVASPPPDVFDLILMDEAHHSPATTWKALLDAFPSSKKVLCTATPFRLDEERIEAKTIYEYSLQRALDDGIICPLEYIPVLPSNTDSIDIALARRAERTLTQQRRLLKDQISLLVRTDSRDHADELLSLYNEHTNLRLRSVHSRHSRRHIESCITKLKNDELDGLLCVDMLGEGFDFPPLKVAVIHRKHKSLPVTLQFIGRFGRSTSNLNPELERAIILASPDELSGEVRKLYQEGAAWERLIPMLHASRLKEDQELAEDIDGFKEQHAFSPSEIDELSLWNLTPLAHVKVYQARPRDKQIDITSIVTPHDVGQKSIENLRIEYCATSEILSTVVLVTREAKQPRWSRNTALSRIEYDLFVIVWYEPARLLFICASRRGSIRLYEALADLYIGTNHRPLPLYKINRVLRNLEGLECFNLGMRTRQVSQVVESYRIVAGRRADRTISAADGRLFHRGHVFSRAIEAGEPTTLGYSSASKIWSLNYLEVPRLARWCFRLGEKISNADPVNTDSGLENLPVGEELTSVPDNLISAEWNDVIYLHPSRLSWEDNGTWTERDILDSSWSVRRESRTDRSIGLTLSIGDIEWLVVFSLDEPNLYHANIQGTLPRILIQDEPTSLLSFLRQYPLNMYTHDYSRCHGDEFFPSPPTSTQPLSSRVLHPIQWTDLNVDITKEFNWLGTAYTVDGFDPTSIHGFLATWLLGDTTEVLFYDHGTGELADFVQITEENSDSWVQLYHVKASGSEQPGNRVGDVYEVCGQVVKSLIWITKPEDLASQIERRNAGKSFFIHGDTSTLRRLLSDRARRVRFSINLVQPGISKSQIDHKLLEVLAASEEYVRRSVGESITVICSP